MRVKLIFDYYVRSTKEEGVGKMLVRAIFRVVQSFGRLAAGSQVSFTCISCSRRHGSRYHISLISELKCGLEKLGAKLVD